MWWISGVSLLLLLLLLLILYLRGTFRKKVQYRREDVPSIEEPHDLHIWAMSTTETALTAHLVMLTGNPGDAFLSRISMELHDNFGIEHTTIQVETGNFMRHCDQKTCCEG